MAVEHCISLFHITSVFPSKIIVLEDVFLYSLTVLLGFTMDRNPGSNADVLMRPGSSWRSPLHRMHRRDLSLGCSEHHPVGAPPKKCRETLGKFQIIRQISRSLWLLSGKLTGLYGKSPFIMGRLKLFSIISHVSHCRRDPEGNYHLQQLDQYGPIVQAINCPSFSGTPALSMKRGPVSPPQKKNCVFSFTMINDIHSIISTFQTESASVMLWTLYVLAMVITK